MDSKKQFINLTHTGNTMKKLLALLVIACAVSTTQAQSWTFIGRAGDGMTQLVRFPSTTSYNNGRVESAWTKNIFTNGTYSLGRFEVHCPSAMWRVVQYAYYSVNGVPIAGKGYDYDSNIAWQMSLPDSMGEGLHKTLCLH
jgi:hypothetical protein